uniref:SRP54-type proteins GTP-binding domain-containing protein n=1 Tax=Plectus sambesii TaxID=2011161 RepID=A0A914UKG4_9BILA
ERGNTSVFKHDGLTLKFKLDNEFELIFLVVYQDVIQLSYADKLLSDIQLEFRDRYKNVLTDNVSLLSVKKNYFKAFDDVYVKCLKNAQHASIVAPPTKMRQFDESDKSKKTVETLIVQRAGGPSKQQQEKEKQEKEKEKAASAKSQIPVKSPTTTANKVPSSPKSSPTSENGSPTADGMDEIAKNREALFRKMKTGGAEGKKEKPKPAAVAEKGGAKKGKQNRVWGLSGTNADAVALDHSAPRENGATEQEVDERFVEDQRQYVGQLKGELQGLDEDQSEPEGDDESEDENDSAPKAQSGGGWFSAFKSLVSNKKLSMEDIEPALDKMREHLIGKNVASEIAEKLCDSVKSKLEGKVIGTFSRVASTVKESLREALVQLLSPKRRVDILRDVLEAKNQQRPYVIVFCGVNGVGKSTNLAKITFWLNENGHRVLIAAGDTFRAGAVEQLRTHTKHLNALHPNSVQLYEQGYGKDPAGLAAQAVAIAAERQIDVVLVDTAGRMQDNEPLMRALSKLIVVNEPDLILFVGEALVGNEAVDQLVKFNQALADNATPGSKARLIDGIVLTKFDTIDDKVGAAISMTYITGQPIVFVGTGQTYKDLKNLNANAVVNSLLK